MPPSPELGLGTRGWRDDFGASDEISAAVWRHSGCRSVRIIYAAGSLKEVNPPETAHEAVWSVSIGLTKRHLARIS